MLIGEAVGPHRVVAKLGAGGMGEVYRATDTNLRRQVALKVLPASLAADADRLARFQREAEVLAALNHPHIAAIYGLERSAGVSALVMELVEGEDLSQRIARGALPLDEALPIARQIADALEAAHEQGIVHRDLKPANVKVREDGTVKVLDFGLAKALAPEGAEARPDPAHSPTRLTAATELGMILGTAAYMSPEQARGRPVDRRADLWAFGCVLYEMLTGTPLWKGETVTDVLAAVVTGEPDWRRLPAHTPAAVRRLLRRCLEKDPRRRLRHAGDAAVEIDEALLAPGQEAGLVALTPAHGGVSRRARLAGAAALVLALGAGAAAGWWMKPAEDIARPVMRFAMQLADRQRFGNLTLPSVVVSPDGSRIAYVTHDGVYVQDFDALEPRRLVGSATAGVFFSPDGEWIGYQTPGGLMKIPLAGGTAQVVSAAAGSTPGITGCCGAHWSDEGWILFARGEGVFRVRDTGGTPELLFAPEPPMRFSWPQMLPGGRHVLYNEVQPGGVTYTKAVVRSVDGSGRDVVLEGAPHAVYAPTGHLVFGRESRLLAAPFDLATRRVTGPAVPLPHCRGRRRSAAPRRRRSLAMARWCSCLPHTIRTRPSSSDRQGRTTAAGRLQRQYSDLRLSPEGQRAAMHLMGGDDDIWVQDLVRGTLTRLTFDPAEDETPVWSPTGTHVAYAATRGATRGVYRPAADGSTAEELLWTSPVHSHVMDWSPDGQALIVQMYRQDTGTALLLLDLATRETRPLVTSPFNELFARFSPDGKWLAYGSDESGRPEVYVQPYPALDARVQISTEGGGQPVWSRDGTELYFRGPTHVLAATLTSRAPLAFSAPQALFPDRFEHAQAGSHTSWDVGPDGRFLLLVQPGQLETSDVRRPEIRVVLNWFEELKRLVPR